MADYTVRLTRDVEGELAKRLLAAGEVKFGRNTPTFQFTTDKQAIVLEVGSPVWKGEVVCTIRGKSIIFGRQDVTFHKDTSSPQEVAQHIWTTIED